MKWKRKPFLQMEVLYTMEISRREREDSPIGKYQMLAQQASQM